MESLPTAFRAPVWLQRLNVIAVAASLAACTGVALSGMNVGADDFDTGEPAHLCLSTGAASALSTFAFGLVWAALLRIRKSRAGWAAAGPLASITAGTAYALCRPGLGNFVLGATFGILIWGPALVLTLVFFGLPIFFARAAAERGLSSEERGELAVGVVAALLAVFALVCDMRLTGIDAVVSGILGAAGALAGAAAAVASAARDRERMKFLASVRAGEVGRFRIEPAAGGDVVVRVSEVGHAYRGAELCEPVVLLDESGGAKSSLSL